MFFITNPCPHLNIKLFRVTELNTWVMKLIKKRHLAQEKKTCGCKKDSCWQIIKARGAISWELASERVEERKHGEVCGSASCLPFSLGWEGYSGFRRRELQYLPVWCWPHYCALMPVCCWPHYCALSFISTYFVLTPILWGHSYLRSEVAEQKPETSYDLCKFVMLQNPSSLYEKNTIKIM